MGLTSCERDFALWFGFAGRSASEASLSEGGRSPGWAGPWPRFKRAACFLAFAAARRASRLRSLAAAPAAVVAVGWVLGPASSEEDSSESSSEEDSSSLEVAISSSFSC